MSVVTRETFLHALEDIKQHDVLYVDLETTGVKPWTGDQLCGIAVLAGDNGYYFPFRHSGGQNLPLSFIAALGEVLADPRKTYVGHNYKFDLNFLSVDGVGLPERIQDTMLGMHLVNENEPSFALKKLGERHLEEGSADEDAALKDTLNVWGYDKGEMWRLMPAQVAPYAIQDVVLTKNLLEWLLPQLEKQKLMPVFEGVNQLALATARMEQLGMNIDVDLCREYVKEADQKSIEFQQSIDEMAGHHVNAASPKQLSAWLGVGSTALEVLETLGEDRKDVQAVLGYRSWSKANNTYYRRFLKDLSRSNDDAVRCNLKIHGTISGRMACTDPNMQAIPRKSDAYKVKDVIAARPGYTLVEADYSQAEIRVATHYAQERRMAALLLQGADIHGATAEAVDIPRFAAKRLNFSVIYGIGAESLARNLKTSEREAQKYLYKYHDHYPGFRALLRKAERTAKDKGYISLFTGRRRHYNTPHADPHKASSNLIQGCVAEMVRVAICRIWAELDRKQVRMLLTVHDSIIFEIRNEVLGERLRDIRRIMEDNPWCTIPMKVDIKIGRSWGTAEEWEE